ncbi:hypothetical protein KFL_001940020 [Klebsormidium nitens]|uniref:Oxysterol-binding protein n=1 Tax=Klebsormidium nitens TaxID=105231 RepID=A0A1Y1I0V6_KLENI|nr:hypothetical protein KFL_001940020 [Klebsormidium nitens]|eukprot:GAQ84545.1 hypothetical protein KFL_001940020 [Klebsormidium nitens]
MGHREEGQHPKEEIVHKNPLLRVLSLQAFRSKSAKKGTVAEEHEVAPRPSRRSLTLLPFKRRASLDRKQVGDKKEGIEHKQVVDESPSLDAELSEEEGELSAPSDDIMCTEPAGAAAHPEGSQKGLVPRMLGLLRSGLAATGDLTKLQVPPQFNMPKSQLQLYGEAIYACNQTFLAACTEGASPLDRLLAVVRWHLSTVRSPLFGKAPYNPIEGETHHVSAGGLRLLAEQVSHHPPVSAIYASHPSKQTRVLWQHQAAPRFTGSAVEVAIRGRRRLFLDAHGEVYELDSPNLSFRLLPTPLAQWTGHTRVVCEASGLVALVHFRAKGAFGWGKGQGVSGKVGRLGADGGIKKGGEMLTIEGHWDGLVHYSVKGSKKSMTLLYDSAAALRGIHAPQVASKTDVAQLESCRVWAPLSKALLASDWETARKTKKGIEDRQRRIRRERKQGGGAFVPAYFREKEPGEWVWKGPGTEVQDAPLVF